MQKINFSLPLVLKAWTALTSGEGQNKDMLRERKLWCLSTEVNATFGWPLLLSLKIDEVSAYNIPIGIVACLTLRSRNLTHIFFQR